ncbi:UNVERIFIED_CONTAM: hypothetical protein RKD50_009662 [Streptomyces canus]
MTTLSPPDWPHCGHGADPATDSVGCRGIHVPSHTTCLAHLNDTDRTAYLTGLVAGADIDHRATSFTPDLLEILLSALIDPTTSTPRLGDVRFDRAQFTGDVRFDRAQFTGRAWFDGAQFTGATGFNGAQFTDFAGFNGAQFSDLAVFTRARFTSSVEFNKARFTGDAAFHEAQFTSEASFLGAQFTDQAIFYQAQFTDRASFDGAQFAGPARFHEAQFAGLAMFHEAQFTSEATFSEAQFTGHAMFDGAQFAGPAVFAGARFTRDARFSGTRFEGVSVLGPLACVNSVVLSGAIFAVPVTLEIEARHVVCARTRWESTATVRLRNAGLDLSHAVLIAPVAVLARSTPFTLNDTTVNVAPPIAQGMNGRVQVISVQGVDAAHLVLTDTDLTHCLFSGAFHLDQIRLEGRTTFPDVPTGWHRRGVIPIRYARRRVLAEEHYWRYHNGPHRRGWYRGWHRGPHPSDPSRIRGPEDVAALYRQLRKAFEDGKNEPGAADFYYGECEMRRHDLSGTSRGERLLLWGYWLLSGYGLRASRAFGWLLAAMTVTVLLLMGAGLPTHDPDPATTGTLQGSRISLNTSTPVPALHGGWSQRMTWVRAEKATRIAVNSVVFRSSGQNLTTAGTYIEMASRLLEPTLLALGALAIRGRIKR